MAAEADLLPVVISMRRLLGQSGRWGAAPRWTEMDRSPVVGADISLNDRFVFAPDTEDTFVTLEVQRQVFGSYGPRRRHTEGARLNLTTVSKQLQGPTVFRNLDHETWQELSVLGPIGNRQVH